MIRRACSILVVLVASAVAAEPAPLPLVFRDDFSKGAGLTILDVSQVQQRKQNQQSPCPRLDCAKSQRGSKQCQSEQRACGNKRANGRPRSLPCKEARVAHAESGFDLGAWVHGFTDLKCQPQAAVRSYPADI